MDKIFASNLVWIFSTESHSKSTTQYESGLDSSKDNKFIKLISEGDLSEYTPEYYENINRYELLAGTISVFEHEFKLSVIQSDYKKYKCSLVYIYLEIDSKDGFPAGAFARMTSGSNILEHQLVDTELTLGEMLENLKIKICGSGFLINQIRKTDPSIPTSHLVDSKEFIQERMQFSTQLVLRSNTDAQYLSPSNHHEYLEDISNFKGSIELCSGSAFVQYHFTKIDSLANDAPIDADKRLSWMSSVITMVNIQSVILKNAIKRIDDMSTYEANKKLCVTNELKSILVELKEYWDVDAMIHPMTARKINIYKSRMGVADLFKTLQYRMESSENLALRELATVQNEQDKILNYILLLIASIQIMPFVYQMIKYIQNKPATAEFLDFGATLFLSSFLPLLILKNKQIRRRMGRMFSYK